MPILISSNSKCFVRCNLIKFRNLYTVYCTAYLSMAFLLEHKLDFNHLSPSDYSLTCNSWPFNEIYLFIFVLAFFHVRPPLTVQLFLRFLCLSCRGSLWQHPRPLSKRSISPRLSSAHKAPTLSTNSQTRSLRSIARQWSRSRKGPKVTWRWCSQNIIAKI